VEIAEQGLAAMQQPRALEHAARSGRPSSSRWG
jgi:hypothetical protein